MLEAVQNEENEGGNDEEHSNDQKNSLPESGNSERGTLVVFVCIIVYLANVTFCCIIVHQSQTVLNSIHALVSFVEGKVGLALEALELATDVALGVCAFVLGVTVSILIHEDAVVTGQTLLLGSASGASLGAFLTIAIHFHPSQLAFSALEIVSVLLVLLTVGDCFFDFLAVAFVIQKAVLTHVIVAVGVLFSINALSAELVWARVHEHC